MKVSADRTRCIGAGNCVLTDERVFDQDDDALVVVLQPEPGPDDERAVRAAVASCPSGALSISD